MSTQHNKQKSRHWSQARESHTQQAMTLTPPMGPVPWPDNINATHTTYISTPQNKKNLLTGSNVIIDNTTLITTQGEDNNTKNNNYRIHHQNIQSTPWRMAIWPRWYVISRKIKSLTAPWALISHRALPGSRTYSRALHTWINQVITVSYGYI